MAWLRILCVAGAASLLAGCATQQKPDYLRVSTPCAPNLVSLAVLF